MSSTSNFQMVKKIWRKRGRKTPIFEKYFKNVPKIIFSIFWHFYTRPAILYVWKKFHNHSFFPSYFFHHLKIGGRWHISYRLSVLWNGIFILGPQFCTCGKIFITIAFFFHIFFTLWKLEVDDTSAIDSRSWGMSAIYMKC